ncbi:MAG: hypothetical protein JWO38_4672 [Gemmataceae bacterium]|nr:hypothetical protein [Gemmataceae bacterium]
MDSALLHPTKKAVSTALTKAIAAANKKLPPDQCLDAGEITPKATVRSADSAEGAQYWRTRAGSEDRLPTFASLAWWTDALGRKHVRVLGGSCDVDSPVAVNATHAMPAVWHVFFEACYFSDRPTSNEVLLVCGCGAFGTAEAIAWRGSGCGQCHEQAGQGHGCPPPASLPVGSARWTPDGRGLVYNHAETGISHLDLKTGTRTEAPVKAKTVGPAVVFNPDEPECLFWLDHGMYRWNWATNKKPVPASKVFKLDYGGMVYEFGSPNGRWVGSDYNIRPVDWAKAGNPVGKGIVFPTDPKTHTLPYVNGQFIADGTWIGITPAGQIDAVDPATGVGTMVKPATTFPNLLPEGTATPRIKALNWERDRICLTFTYQDRPGYHYRPPVVVGPIRGPGPWQVIPVSDDDLPILHALTFTPDGRWLVSGRGANMLTLHPLDGGEPRRLSFALPHVCEGVSGVAFSPDGDGMLVMMPGHRSGRSKEIAPYLWRIPSSSAALDALFQSHRPQSDRFLPAPTDSEFPVPSHGHRSVAAGTSAGEFTPCIFRDGDDDWYSLSFSAFDATNAIFEAEGLEGGGYGWHGVVDALIRMQAPKIKRRLQFDPEGSAFVVLSKSRDALVQVAHLIRSAVADPDILRAALKKANRKLMG